MKLYAYRAEIGSYGRGFTLTVCEVTETPKMYKLVYGCQSSVFRSQFAKSGMDEVMPEVANYTYAYYTLTRDDEGVMEKIREYITNDINEEIDRINQKIEKVNTLSCSDMTIRGVKND